MTPEQQRAGALEAIERIVNRGGDADDVLKAVHGVVGKLGPVTADDAAFVARVTTLLSAYGTRPEKMRSIFSVEDRAPGCVLSTRAPQPPRSPLPWSRCTQVARSRYPSIQVPRLIGG